METWIKKNAFQLNEQLGLGGVPIGTAFEKISESEAQYILQKAWDLGVRYYDTSPWYGLTRSERTFGAFLKDKPREDFVFSTKVGRLFRKVPENKVPPTMWLDPLPYDFEHSYTADAVKKAIADSLERSGLIISILYIYMISQRIKWATVILIF
ncbi:aldo/keto reductase [Olivibacter domesticus]|uniref:Aldo/keto reductase family protein n=1 Tax=Olivibacter domesticus TaxID=407022 RepID=A0A1H7JJN9_OLID1|nr:aldo/keto reductase [Olivibacter domesticus]SEK73685.1 Aldo/keto reductase family protein [Olivibacter domesticus]